LRIRGVPIDKDRPICSDVEACGEQPGLLCMREPYIQELADGGMVDPDVLRLAAPSFGSATARVVPWRGSLIFATADFLCVVGQEELLSVVPPDFCTAAERGWLFHTAPTGPARSRWLRPAIPVGCAGVETS